MRFRRLCGMLAVLAIAGASPHLAFAATQRALGVGTSAKPTAPPGSALNRLQVQFDPVATTDIERGVSGFQLTVGWNSLQLSLDSTLPIYNSPFTAAEVAISQPYTHNSGETSLVAPSTTMMDTFVTVYGRTTQPIAGDVDIFSLIFIPNSISSSLPVAPVIGIGGSDHSNDRLPPGQAVIGPDFVILTDPHNLDDNLTVGPSGIETTVITTEFGLNPTFTTQEGNSPLAVGVPLPRAFWPAVVGLALIGLCQGRLRRSLA
jgi:hypothetical protein